MASTFWAITLSVAIAGRDEECGQVESGDSDKTRRTQGSNTQSSPLNGRYGLVQLLQHSHKTCIPAAGPMDRMRLHYPASAAEAERLRSR
jgi:hypothetical protein